MKIKKLTEAQIKELHKAEAALVVAYCKPEHIAAYQAKGDFDFSIIAITPFSSLYEALVRKHLKDEVCIFILDTVYRDDEPPMPGADVHLIMEQLPKVLKKHLVKVNADKVIRMFGGKNLL